MDAFASGGPLSCETFNPISPLSCGENMSRPGRMPALRTA